MADCSLFSKKIAVVGAGFVGASFAYAAMLRNLASEVILFDRNVEKAQGEALDLDHGLPYVETGSVKATSTYEDLHGADIVVITAGVNQKPEQTRLELVQQNAAIMKDIVLELDTFVPDAILIVVSNPVDVLTTLVTKYSKRPPHKILGSGTVLDSARLKYLLAKEFKVSPHSVSGYVLGEHGDSEFVAWSTVDVGGTLAKTLGFTAKDELRILDLVRNSAYEIIQKKGATYYGIGLSLCEIVESIVYDQRMILPVSAFAHPMGSADLALGLPSIVGKNGIEGYISLQLSSEEQNALEHSIEVLSEVLEPLLR